MVSLAPVIPVISDSPAPAPTPPPGYLSSEFWTHIFVIISTMAGSTVVLFGNTGLPTWIQGLVPVAATIATLISQLWYTSHRKDIKTATLATYTTWIESHTSDFQAIWDAINDVRAGRVPPTMPDVHPLDSITTYVVHPDFSVTTPAAFDMNAPVVTHT